MLIYTRLYRFIPIWPRWLNLLKMLEEFKEEETLGYMSEYTRRNIISMKSSKLEIMRLTQTDAWFMQHEVWYCENLQKALHDLISWLPRDRALIVTCQGQLSLGVKQFVSSLKKLDRWIFRVVKLFNFGLKHF